MCRANQYGDRQLPGVGMEPCNNTAYLQLLVRKIRKIELELWFPAFGAMVLTPLEYEVFLLNPARPRVQRVTKILRYGRFVAFELLPEGQLHNRRLRLLIRDYFPITAIRACMGIAKQVDADNRAARVASMRPPPIFAMPISATGSWHFGAVAALAERGEANPHDVPLKTTRAIHHQQKICRS